MPAIVLASSSKYRRDLLKKLPLDFVTCDSAIDENPLPNEAPNAQAIRLATAKAQTVATKYPDHLIIGSDQVAACNEIRLGKPGTKEQAIRQLHAQSGQIVRFYTGLCVFNSRTGDFLTDLDICSVYFKHLSPQQIEHYVDLDRPFDCAGSFKSEGLGIALFSRIETSDPNALIGLPLIKLIALLEKFGVNIL